MSFGVEANVARLLVWLQRVGMNKLAAGLIQRQRVIRG